MTYTLELTKSEMETLLLLVDGSYEMGDYDEDEQEKIDLDLDQVYHQILHKLG